MTWVNFNKKSGNPQLIAASKHKELKYLIKQLIKFV